MKQWKIQILMVIFVAIIFGGYGYAKVKDTNEQYQHFMQQANKALNNKDYNNTEYYLKNALQKTNQDDDAKLKLKQVQQYREAKIKQDNLDYHGALQAYQDVKTTNAYARLTKRAQKKIKFINKILKKEKIYQKSYDEALYLTGLGHYNESNQALVTILFDPTANQPYLKKYLNNGYELQFTNNEALKQIVKAQQKLNQEFKQQPKQQAPPLNQEENQSQQPKVPQIETKAQKNKDILDKTPSPESGNNTPTSNNEKTTNEDKPS
ncbi:hypothetical protein FC40_GL001522 [Ligilactobacillus hayakitensis DSM 18933 = JCM 14209]|uniref:Uncharacterized protein n=1 Tax=Ligilactobacillus hayakitensis DSM 18933 = JCM 14209 TaxID=1423755 RepID=A0A0R1WP61_9LACO|nr:hypothetical protein [Ligilactobacillus hayakitensis]KRM19671.1 hypothetical protein FC40_GL001522 [Ligilactobacillus hayakitensis DSM 18933 = JCM 14209]